MNYKPRMLLTDRLEDLHKKGYELKEIRQDNKREIVFIFNREALTELFEEEARISVWAGSYKTVKDIWHKLKSEAQRNMQLDCE